jgi:serine/threonine protein kinase/class 3 adenylate cyclase
MDIKDESMVGADEALADLRKEIEHLRRENTRLQEERDSSGGLLAPESASLLPGSEAPSIAGVEILAFRVNTEQRICYANTALVHYLSVSKEDLLGQPMARLHPFFNRELIQAMAAPTEGTTSAPSLVDDGKGRTFEVKATLIKGDLDVVLKDVTEEVKFRRHVQKYVSVDLSRLSEEDLRTFRFPERRFMTAGFTDMRGFTALSEKLSPEEVRDTMNAYFQEVMGPVENNKATVDKIIGDEVMALYGAPVYFRDHAFRAVKTACEQVRRVKHLGEVFAKSGKAMPGCGVGLGTGEMVLGNMGGSHRQDYTVVGATVNLAARLCGAAQEGEILLTEATLTAVLAELPEGWEVSEFFEASEDDSSGSRSAAVKIEAVQMLGKDKAGKVVRIGPGLGQEPWNAVYEFRYLHAVKAKGFSKPVPVIRVECLKHEPLVDVLRDERAEPSDGGQIFGKYRLLELIGRGGMGEVWRARDQFGNMVAVKTLLPGLGSSASQIRRFRQEASVMARLRHRNICRIHEVGECEDMTYIAMEYVNGVSVSELLSHFGADSEAVQRRLDSQSHIGLLVETIHRERSDASRHGVEGIEVLHETPAEGKYRILPLPQTLAIMTKICEAIQFAHEHGIFHRDLKPANIMLGTDGEPVLMDFGLAKLEDKDREVSLSLSGQIIGTLDYMAPEQARSSKEVNERADVYSLGAILYQMVIGQKHFNSTGNLITDASRLQEHEPMRPRQLRRDLDPDLETVILKALRSDPNERYASARQLSEDLQRYQAGDPISAEKPNWVYQLQKKVRKHRMTFAFSAVIAVLLSAFSGYMVYDYFKQWGDWIEVYRRDFDKPADESVEKLAFYDGTLRRKMRPWPVENGALQAKAREWCWLEGLELRGDVRVMLKVKVPETVGALDVCIGSEREGVPNSQTVPAGYSFQLAGRGGLLDFVSRNDTRRVPAGDNPVPTSLVPGKTIWLTFERHQEGLVLRANRHETIRELDLLPMRGRDRANIGFRFQAGGMEIREVRVYRLALPEKASPLIAGDSLVESGDLPAAIARYRTIAQDYAGTEVAEKALIKAYLAAVSQAREDTALRQEIQKEMEQFYPRSAYREKIFEYLALNGWKEKRFEEVLGLLPGIFQVNPDTRIVKKLLDQPVRPVSRRIGSEMLKWVARTERPENISLQGMDLGDLSPLAKTEITVLDCSRNRISDLKPLRGMPLRELDCGFNPLATLEPLQGMDLVRLEVPEARLTSLAPLKNIPLRKLVCHGNPLTTLDPFVNDPPEIFDFDCESLPAAELERMIAAWTSPRHARHRRNAEVLLALRKQDYGKLRALALSWENHAYLFMPRFVGWDEARSLAKKIGGHLATAGSKEENEFMASLLPAETAAWIGLRQEGNGSAWETKEAVAFEAIETEGARVPWMPYVLRNGSWHQTQAEEPAGWILEWEPKG